MAFANPGFLWAMGLAVIPLWLHLSRRRKFRKLEVGTLRFLEHAHRSRQRKARWDEVLLMLMRVGATLLLALLFARPTVPGRPNQPATDEYAIILLDASGSISAAMAEEIRKQAKQALRRAGAKRTLTIAQFSDRVESLESLDEFLPQPGAATNLAGALDWALDRFQQNGDAGAGELIVIGHFATSALPEVPPRVWPVAIEVNLIPVLPATVLNSAVTDVQLRTPYETEAMELEATVKLPLRDGGTVTIEAEGYIEEKLLAAGSERVLFQFRPSREQVRGWISVKGASDPWPLDDRRPFVFQWTERSRILLVDGDPGSTPFEGEAYFLQKALEASGAEHGLSQFAAEISYGLENRQGLTNLSEYAAIALCGIEEFSKAEADLLREYVDSGGGLLVVVGNRWDPTLYASLVDVGLFPPSSADNSGDERRPISRWDAQHPALAAFANPDGGDLRALLWRDGYAIQADEEWKNLAQTDVGRPILLARNRVIVCAHPLNREWTDLPRQPIFVPLVKNLFSFLASTQEPPAPVEVVVLGIGEDRKPGWYALQDQRGQVVVTDAAESDVSVAEPVEVARSLGLPPASVGESALENLEIDAAINLRDSRFHPYELWPWIALLLLVWFVAEGVMATAPRRDSPNLA